MIVSELFCVTVEAINYVEGISLEIVMSNGGSHYFS